MSNTNFGNSLLPSHNPQTYDILEGKFGKLQVKPIPEYEQNALFYLANPVLNIKRDWMMLAIHPNGHSCKALAERIIKVWNQEMEDYYAMSQFHYILDCGGLGKSEYDMKIIIAGEW